MTEHTAERGDWTKAPAKPAPTEAGVVCVDDDPVTFAAEMGFAADDKQAAVLRAMGDPSIKQGILNCTRQWGKSTTVAAGAVHRLVTRPGCLVVVASPSKKQSAELVR